MPDSGPPLRETTVTALPREGEYRLSGADNGEFIAPPDRRGCALMIALIVGVMFLLDPALSLFGLHPARDHGLMVTVTTVSVLALMAGAVIWQLLLRRTRRMALTLDDVTTLAEAGISFGGRRFDLSHRGEPTGAVLELTATACAVEDRLGLSLAAAALGVADEKPDELGVGVLDPLALAMRILSPPRNQPIRVTASAPGGVEAHLLRHAGQADATLHVTGGVAPPELLLAVLAILARFDRRM